MTHPSKGASSRNRYSSGGDGWGARGLRRVMRGQDGEAFVPQAVRDAVRRRRRQQHGEDGGRGEMRRGGERAGFVLATVIARFGGGLVLGRIAIRLGHLHVRHVHLGHVHGRHFAHVADDEGSLGKTVRIGHPARWYQGTERHRDKRKHNGGAAEPLHGAELTPIRPWDKGPDECVTLCRFTVDQ